MAVTTQEVVQRRPEYLETFEKGLLDALLGQYDPETGWVGETDPTKLGLAFKPEYFNIPEYTMATQPEGGLEQMAIGALQSDANGNGVPDFLERYQPYFEQAGQFMTGGQEALYRGLGSMGDAVSFFGPAAGYVGAGVGQFNAPETYAAALDPAIAAAQQAAGLGQGYIASGMGEATPTRVGEFMDPYRQKVIDAAMRNIERQGDVARKRGAAQAIGAGAFGGSREGIQRAETERALMETKADVLSNLLSSGYTQALGESLKTQENALTRALQGGQTAGQLGLEGSRQIGAFGQIGAEAAQKAYQDAMTRSLEAGRLTGGLGQSLGQIGSQYGTMGQQYGQLGAQTADIGRVFSALAPADLATMYEFGGAQRAYDQSVLDMARREAMRPTEQALLPYNYAYEVLSGTPSANLYGTYTTGYQPQANPYISGLGAYSALQGVYGGQQ